MRGIEAIIFDWAGTTVDYGSFAPVRAFLEVFREYGIEPTLDEVREPMGMLKIDHIRTMLQMERIDGLWNEVHGRAWIEEDVKNLYHLFEGKLMEILDQHAEPKPGVLDTIEKLRKKGIKIGSTTGYTDKMMSVVAPKAKEQGYAPDVWISPDSVQGIGRPYPYMIFKNMEALGLSDVRKIIKIGDTVSDIREGKNSGAVTVGVIDGSSEMGMTRDEFEICEDKNVERKRVAERYKKAGADFVIPDLEAILTYLQ